MDVYDKDDGTRLGLATTSGRNLHVGTDQDRFGFVGSVSSGHATRSAILSRAAKSAVRIRNSLFDCNHNGVYTNTSHSALISKRRTRSNSVPMKKFAQLLPAIPAARKFTQEKINPRRIQYAGLQCFLRLLLSVSDI